MIQICGSNGGFHWVLVDPKTKLVLAQSPIYRTKESAAMAAGRAQAYMNDPAIDYVDETNLPPKMRIGDSRWRAIDSAGNIGGLVVDQPGEPDEGETGPAEIRG